MSARFAASFYKKQSFLARTLKGPGLSAIVFDAAGTLIDPHTNSVVQSIRHSIAKRYPKIHLTDHEIRSHMGMKKMEHLQNLFEIPSVRTRFTYQYLRSKPSVNDLQGIHKSLENAQIEHYLKYPEATVLLPHVETSLTEIRQLYPELKMNITSGFPKSILNVVKNNIRDSNNHYIGSIFHKVVASDEVPRGRPSGDMIRSTLGLFWDPSVQSSPNENETYCLPVLNLGDTEFDVKSGNHAQCISGAVIKYSNDIAMYRKNDIFALSKTRKKMFDAGADFVIDTMEDLLLVVAKLNKARF